MEDYKKYFLEKDVFNFLDDLSFTLLDTYKCDNGCKECFLNEEWPYVDYPKENTPKIKNLYKFRDWFNTTTNVDDLLLLKNRYSTLYEVLQDHSPDFSKSLTNYGVVKWADIMVNDFNFNGISEITMNYKIVLKFKEEIKKALLKMSKKYKIRIYKLVRINTTPEEHDAIIDFEKWLKANIDTNLLYHNEDWHDVNYDNITFAEKSCEYVTGIKLKRISHNPVSILDNCMIYQQNKMYFFWVDLLYHTDFIDGNLSIDKFLFETLRMKEKKYSYFVNNLQDWQEETEDAKFLKEYFRSYVDFIKLNENYNFIPMFSLDNRPKMINALDKAGWIKIKNLGFINKNSKLDKTIPMYEFK